MKNLQRKWHIRNDELYEHAKRIHVREDSETVVQIIWKKRLRIVVLLLFLIGIAFIFCFTQSPVSETLADNCLTRGEEEKEVHLIVQGKDEKGVIEKEVVLSLDSRQFTKEEKQELTEHVKSYLDNNLKGKNTSLKKVSHDLNFVKSVPQTEVSFLWMPDENYITSEGKIVEESISKEGVETELDVTATWKNWKETYHFSIFLLKPVYSREELFEKEVKQVLQKRLQVEAEQSVVHLPKQIEGKEIFYATTDEKKNYSLVYVLLLVLLLLPFIWHYRQKEEQKKREEQLLLDHPRVVNRFMLLLGAGLTLRKIVERLVAEYESVCEKGGERRYVYEEMCVLLQEMRDGVSEGDAFLHFGKRCALLPYLRFTSVLTQNMKKGAEGILQILEKESIEALEQRKQRILQLGEKAGTKLLFPMMVMLGLVMAIIMVPAFMTM